MVSRFSILLSQKKITERKYRDTERLNHLAQKKKKTPVLLCADWRSGRCTVEQPECAVSGNRCEEFAGTSCVMLTVWWLQKKIVGETYLYKCWPLCNDYPECLKGQLPWHYGTTDKGHVWKNEKHKSETRLSLQLLLKTVQVKNTSNVIGFFLIIFVITLFFVHYCVKLNWRLTLGTNIGFIVVVIDYFS